MLNILGYQTITFVFPETKTSSITVDTNFSTPTGTDGTMLMITGFDVMYTDQEEYGFGEFQVQVQPVSNQSAQCTVTLRDNNTNDRQWNGSVNAMVLAYQGH